MNLIDLAQSGDPIGVVLGIVTGVSTLGGGFLWLIKRQDRLYDKSEELHKSWLEEEKSIREAQKAEAAKERLLADQEIEKLKLIITTLYDDLNMCLTSCRKVMIEKTDLEIRVRLLEAKVNDNE